MWFDSKTRFFDTTRTPRLAMTSVPQLVVTLSALGKQSTRYNSMLEGRVAYEWMWKGENSSSDDSSSERGYDSSSEGPRVPVLRQ